VEINYTYKVEIIFIPKTSYFTIWANCLILKSNKIFNLFAVFGIVFADNL